MSFDLFATLTCESQAEVNDLARGKWASQLQVPDLHTRIKLMSAALRVEDKWEVRQRKYEKGKDYAREKYQGLISSDSSDCHESEYAHNLIATAQQRLENLKLWRPEKPDFDLLPPFSAFLQFQFTLTRPYISRDDEIFHINDNPVRKDKVFKVPLVGATSWKGNLRWTMMKTDLEPERNDPAEFAHRRFRHALLFGTEKGFETARDWEAFLNELCPGNREIYRQLLREHFSPDGGTSLPHNAGWLRFYPTFFDCIGLEVINPHDRKTRAGTQPIYFESVPIGATGGFSLLYAPFGRVSVSEAKEDLRRIAVGVAAMLLTYGFSAKKTSGFGEAGDDLTNGWIYTADNFAKPLLKLSTLEMEVANVEWS